ncbi:hypothetical protein O6H91_19G075800 [Diphasiastrum complanatum]|uniref:Uncharacterized protein n=1 Tax=Diphasiastrum complanatum TaxID=34168 RepID=A0ACC2AXW0_DIPCM|nr:hypothetical protein O6H91_19G075800 [Diphasiastrum complanatum]
MEIGAHEGLSMPITGDYDTMQEPFRVKLLDSGNGIPLDDIRTMEVKTTKVIKYRECLKNHAASIGGHATDGCGEFMSSGEEGTLDALKCAACECHRNFHRREVEGENSCVCQHILNDKKRGSPPIILPPRAPLQLSSGVTIGRTSAPVIMTAFSELDNREGAAYVSTPSTIKKRFRTKFSAEQKERMFSIAEKLGWKIQKQDEAEVQQFCADVGVKRHVLKVWMHNNRHTLGKK